MVQSAIAPWSNAKLGLVLALDATYKPIGYLFRSFPTPGMRVAAFFVSLFLGSLTALFALSPCACHPKVAAWTAPSLGRVLPLRVRDHEALPHEPPGEGFNISSDSPPASTVESDRSNQREPYSSTDPEAGEGGSDAAKRGGPRGPSNTAPPSTALEPMVAVEKMSLLTPTEAWWIMFAVAMNRAWQIALWTVYALLQRSTSDLSRLLLLGQLVSSLIIPGSVIHLAFSRFDLARMQFLAIQRDVQAQTRMRAQRAMLRWVRAARRRPPAVPPLPLRRRPGLTPRGRPRPQVCHEVRVPLNTVVLGSEHVSSDVRGLLPAEAATPAQLEVQARICDTLRVMQDATKGMHAVVSDMLAFEKAGHGQVELREERACVTTLCDDVVREFRPEADGKGITLDLSPVEHPIVAKLDVARLKQVTRNYVSNAVKFSRPNTAIRVACAVFLPDDAADIAPRWKELGRGMRRLGVRPDSAGRARHTRRRRDDQVLSAAETPVYTCSASLVARSEARRDRKGRTPGRTPPARAPPPGAATVLCISVRDQGHGMHPAQQQKLFQPFSQLRTGAEGKGTGLGLAICRSIGAVHGGTVGCHSEIGRGSEFWIEVPIQTLPSFAATSALPPSATPTTPPDGSLESRLSSPPPAAAPPPALSASGLEIPPLPTGMSPAARGGQLNAALSPPSADAAAGGATLPACPPSLPPAPARALAGAAPRPPSAGFSGHRTVSAYDGLRVLVVDDVGGNRSLLARTIRGFGAAKVGERENGARAVQELARAAAQGSPYHVMFLDKEMPVVDGYGVLDRLHAAASGAAASGGPTPTLADLEVEPTHAADALRHCCVVAVTGNALHGDVTEFKRRGAQAVLRKPVTQNELRGAGSVVERYMKRLQGHPSEDGDEDEYEAQNEDAL